MSVTRGFVLVALVSTAACGPEASPELEDASWIVGRYAAGEACTLKGADIHGQPLTDGWIVRCVSDKFVKMEFFPDGLVRSEFFYFCPVEDVPYHTSESRWRATNEDGVVVVETDDENTDIFQLANPMTSVTARRTDDCLQIYLEQDREDEPAFSILHRGEFEWTSVIPPDRCLGQPRPTSVPECPYDQDE